LFGRVVAQIIKALKVDEALKKAESLLGFYNLVVYGEKFSKEEDQPMN